MNALKWMMLCLLLATVAVAKPKVEQWLDLARQAHGERNWAQAIDYYERALSSPATGDSAQWQAGAAYNLACCYALNGDPERALDAIERATAAGYTDWRWLERDTDFATLKNGHAERFSAAVAACRTAATNERLTKSPIAVVSYDGDQGTADLSGWAWDDPRGPGLTALRKTYRLDSIAAGGTTEWERIRRLLNWTSKRWVHDGSHGFPGCDPMEILAAAEKGERFACIQYAIVLTNVLNAMGYPARLVGLLAEGTAWGYGRGHSAVEVWSNDFQKWVLLDGQNNAWWMARGVPQSGADCRRYFLADQEDSLEFTGQHPGRPYASMGHQWASYFYHVGAQRCNTFYARDDTVKVSRVRYLLNGNGSVPELYHQEQPSGDRLIDDESFLYPALNQARIELQAANRTPPGDTLHVTLQHTSPFFEHYVARFNNGPWQASAARFDWPLAAGRNRLEVKTVNFGGVEGRAATVILQNNLRKGAGN